MEILRLLVKICSEAKFMCKIFTLKTVADCPKF